MRTPTRFHNNYFSVMKRVSIMIDKEMNDIGINKSKLFDKLKFNEGSMRQKLSDKTDICMHKEELVKIFRYFNNMANSLSSRSESDNSRFVRLKHERFIKRIVLISEFLTEYKLSVRAVWNGVRNEDFPSYSTFNLGLTSKKIDDEIMDEVIDFLQPKINRILDLCLFGSCGVSKKYLDELKDGISQDEWESTFDLNKEISKINAEQEKRKVERDEQNKKYANPHNPYALANTYKNEEKEEEFEIFSDKKDKKYDLHDKNSEKLEKDDDFDF